MTAPEQDTTALWREALGAMGYDCIYDGHYFRYKTSHFGARLPSTREDGWLLFGLAVEWIEARGGITHHFRHRDSDYEFGVFVMDVSVHGATLPTAAARWIRDHGDKIAKETT
jgi:hypothetical protein